uniref:Anoctamin n=1 Tax=Oryzias melastigma TaxID=30732 RepID=A0A3B3CQ28_ORYME
MGVISVTEKVYFILTKILYPNSRYDKEKSFTIMMFTFQFLTLFSSLFYVAFFLGRINGHPGNYVRIAGHRLEECHPSGCLTDLFIQMAVIMTLSQGINSIAEITKPKKNVDCWVKPCDYCLFKDWRKNHQLADTDGFSLFHEILEMVIQFSFITLFVAAFPLAPFMALINNIFEIRLDAIKMVQLERRLIPKKTNSIGVWANVLETIGVLAAISNGLVIGITSDFIPRLVYYYFYGPTPHITEVTQKCFIIQFNKSLFVYIFIPVVLLFFFSMVLYKQIPLYFRSEEDHSLTSHFWLVLAARLGFVIVFEVCLRRPAERAEEKERVRRQRRGIRVRKKRGKGG